jgi:EpsD family peptidyl-prolyl cis-trans isomerase
MSINVLQRTRQRAGVLAAVAVMASVLLTACGDTKDKPATQTAAKVNREEITVHQINALLQQQRGLKPEQTDEASRRALERLIDQELALNKAAELKVDREPRVVQALEAARRDIIARAYIEKIGEGASKPTPDEIKAYYDANPALFKDRRVYQLQELAIQAGPDQMDTLRAKLQAAKNINEFVDYLKASNIKYVANQAVRAAEQLPMAALPALAKMKDGQAMLTVTPTGAQVVVLAGSRAQPVEEEPAGKAIEQFLLNERKRKVIADDLKALRSSAKIAYVGKFAASAPAPTEAFKAATPADVAASAAAAAALETTSISQGLGLKTGASAASAAAAADAAVKPASGVDASSISKGLGLK